MFNLDSAIIEWRRQMSAGGFRAGALLDELESHVREDVERQAKSGIEAEQAFGAAVSHLGQPGLLREEFSKIGETGEAGKLRNFLLTLAGIQTPTLATNMNASYTNTNLEPRWATYLKSAGFILPAVTLWTAMVVFVVPKLREVCIHAGVVLPGVYGLVFFLMQHGALICAALAAGLIFLEWRSDRWPRYRRAAFGVGVFVFNAVVLALISSMVVYAVIAAAEFAQHTK
jgi:hypothetical protein